MSSYQTNAAASDWLNSFGFCCAYLLQQVGIATLQSALALTVFSAFLFFAARPAQAQTETVLYNFTGGSDGGGPLSRLTADGTGNFYGTTHSGGLGYGTVFELSPNGSGGWNETTLYSFTGGTDGADPGFSYVIFDGAGNLYGTAYSGGANGYGVVFELSPAAGSWKESVLYSFVGGSQGAGPYNGLIMDAAGNLYGATAYGGNGDAGTVFELSPSGGGWNQQVIHNYYDHGVGNDGAGLTMDAAGNIFGGATGLAFELSPNGAGGWNATVIYTFSGFKAQHYAHVGTPVIDSAGNLYGTAIPWTKHPGSTGMVYKLSPGKNGRWTLRSLTAFYSKKGSYPSSDAVLVFDAAGNIYGTALGGGAFGDGVVYKLVPVRNGGYVEKVLWSFNGTDGSHPNGSLILDSAGNLYGTGSAGGTYGQGVVFEVTP